MKQAKKTKIQDFFKKFLIYLSSHLSFPANFVMQKQWLFKAEFTVNALWNVLLAKSI